MFRKMTKQAKQIQRDPDDKDMTAETATLIGLPTYKVTLWTTNLSHVQASAKSATMRLQTIALAHAIALELQAVSCMKAVTSC